jgi:hypothetical protein
MAYFRKGLKKPLAPDPRGMAGAIAGTFLVGDGTVVGQGSSYVIVPGKAKLVLAGKAFAAVIFTGDFQVVGFTTRPRLLLRGKSFNIVGSSTVMAQLPAKLTLKGRFYVVIVPVFAHTGKPALVLKGKPFATPISSIVNVGKPKLILRGKKLTAAQIALTPTLPTDIALTPSMPVSHDLIPTVSVGSDLVPTIEEVR